MQAHRFAAKLAEFRAYRRIDFVDERMLYDSQRSFIGIAAALYPFRFEAGFVHRFCYGFSAAVNDYRPYADGVHKGNVGQEFLAQKFIVEDAAAEFNDDDSASEAADVLHRFD
jgi:hypothetical protein